MDALRIAQSATEISNIEGSVKSTNEIEGAIAECGVYQGGTASVIYELINPNKKLYLFDTFDNFAGAGQNDPAWIHHLTFDVHPNLVTAFQEVTKWFEGQEKVIIKKGPAQETMLEFKDEKFSLVHLDMDIYYPTLEALKFFYARMPKGGIIIIHDYLHQDLQGVKKAVDEFLSDKPEKVSNTQEMGTCSQAIIIKQ